MNTPAHLIIGLAGFGRPQIRRSGMMALIGSLLPDLSLYLMAGTSLFILQIPPERVFGELYFSSEWQTVFAIDNSFILWGLGLILALWLRAGPGIALFAAGLLHVVLDFTMHHDDARPHFWPISDWVFESPVSYWDSNHHAAWLAPFALMAVLIAAVVVWRRWTSWPVRLVLLVGCALEIWVVRQWLLFF